MVKNPDAMQEIWVHPWVGKIPSRGARQPILVFLPEEFHGQKSLVGYSPWGCIFATLQLLSDMTE